MDETVSMPTDSIKGLILAGGRGKRFDALTMRTPKPLLPIAGKPLIHYNINLLADAGVTDITIVVSPDSFLVKERLGDGSQLDVNLSYIVQKDHLGTAHAIGLAESAMDGGTFLICWSDNMTTWSVKNLVARHRENPEAGTLALHVTDDARKGGAAVVDGDYVIKFEEKPDRPESNLNLAGMYSLEPIIFDAISKTKPSKTGEYYLPDSFQILVDQGDPLQWVPVDDWRMNVNDIGDLLLANRMILSRSAVAPLSADHFDVVGAVKIPECAIVGEGAVVGPDVSLGNGCTIGAGGKVSNAILMDGATIANNDQVHGAIVDDMGRSYPAA